MRAGWRFGIAMIAAALALAPAAAQDNAAATSNTPATDSIGPRELRDFSINGTVTRTAPEPAAAAPPRPAPRTDAPASQPAPLQRPPEQRPRAAEPSRPAPSITMPLPAPEGPADGAAIEPPPSFTTQPNEAPPIIPEAASMPVEPQGSLLPWLLAALLLAGAAGYFAWRQQGRAALAGQAQALEAFVPAEPAAQPAARAPPPRAEPPPPAPAPTIVSTRLRPQLEIEFAPMRCLIEPTRAVIEFEVGIVNSGAAPARDVLVEACMFNAGPTQDQDIGAFLAHPVAAGNRVALLPPLKRLAMKSAVVLGVEQIKMFEVAGRKLFVPLVAINALYRWSGGEGQTSASYLVGRDTQAEKLAPFRLDLGPRVFRGLGAREHHVRLRK